MRGKILTNEQTKFALELAEESPVTMVKYLTWQTAEQDIIENPELNEVYEEAFDNGFRAALDVIEAGLQSKLKGVKENG